MSAEALIEKINSTLGKINEKLTSITNTVNDVLDMIPGFLGWLKDKVVSLWNSFVAKMKEVWAKVEEAWDNIVWPTELWDGADTWNEKVGSPVSGISANASASNTEVDRHWEGDGAEAYIGTLRPQKTAMENIKDFTSKISTALNELAKAELIFLGAFAGGLVVFLGACVAAAITAVTVLGAIGALVGGAAALIGCIAGGLANLEAAAQSQNTTLQSDVVTKWNGFPEKAWPKAVINV